MKKDFVRTLLIKEEKSWEFLVKEADEKVREKHGILGKRSSERIFKCIKIVDHDKE